MKVCCCGCLLFLGSISYRPGAHLLDMVSHGGRSLFWVSAAEGLEYCLMFSDRVFGIGDSDAAKEAEALDLTAQGCVRGHHELVAAMFGDQPVEPFIRFQV